MNLAILVTLLRLLLFPFIIYLYLAGTSAKALLAVVLFFLIILSDALDGYIARRRHEITKFGSFLDPLLDKFIIYIMLILLAIELRLLWIILGVFIFRDAIVYYCRYLAAKHDIEIKEYLYHKIKAMLQYALVFMLLLANYFNFNPANFFMIMASQALALILALLTVLLSLLSIVYYLTKALAGVRSNVKMGRKVKQQKMIVLANKKSRGYRDAYRRRLLKLFSKRRKAIVNYFSVKKRDMYQGVAKKVKSFNHVIIAGGDGSFESALNYKPLWKKSLGFFPLGAGNAFYSYFYKSKRFEYLRSRFHFREMELDVMELEWQGGKRQTLFAGIGVDAEIPRLNKKRTQHGFWDYFAASWNGLFKGKADYEIELKIDKKKYHWDNCINIAFGKIPYYGFAIRSYPAKVNPADNKIYASACVSPHSVLWNKPLRIWGLVMTMFCINKPPMLSFVGKNIHLKSEVPFPVQAGGEFLGYSEWVKIKVVRKQKVLVI